MQSNYRLRLAGFLGLLFLALTVSADDRITERAVFEDAGAELTFEQIQSQAFTPFTGILSRSYGRCALWVRVHIHPGAGAANESLILRVRPGYLDEIRLYDPQYRSLGTQVTGDSVPIARDGYRSLNSNLVIPQGDQPRDVWLRIVSNSTRLFEVKALTQIEVLHQDRIQETPYAIFLAIIGLLALWGAVQWTLRPDRLMLLFTLKETAAFFFMFGLLGYARLLWPGGLTLINAGQYTDWLLPLYSSLGGFFDHRVLRTFHAYPLGLKLLRALAIIFLLEYALLGLGYSQEAFMLNGTGVLLVACLTPLLAMSTPDSSKLAPDARPLLSRRMLILLYSANFLGLMTSVLPQLGLTQASFLVFDGFLVHGVVSGLTMLILMVHLSHQSERRLSAADAAREFAERQAQAEHQQRQDQARFITMLTHELKTPLAVVKMVLGARTPTEEMKSAAKRSMTDMHNIIQRCMQVEQLVDPADPDRRHACCLIEEMADLIRNSSEPRRIRLLSVDLPTLVTDPMILRMIVANLIDNACKYGDAGSSVSVSLTPVLINDHPRICLRVENRPGKAGWPDPQQIFTKFYRAPHAYQVSGSGLGLFLSAHLAKQLGGELRYSPTATDIGFELWIPT